MLRGIVLSCSITEREKRGRTQKELSNKKLKKYTDRNLRIEECIYTICSPVTKIQHNYSRIDYEDVKTQDKSKNTRL